MNNYPFRICDKCKAGYCLSDKKFKNHILHCNGLKDIICPRFYSYDELINNMSNYCYKCKYFHDKLESHNECKEKNYDSRTLYN